MIWNSWLVVSRGSCRNAAILHLNSVYEHNCPITRSFELPGATHLDDDWSEVVGLDELRVLGSIIWSGWVVSGSSSCCRDIIGRVGVRVLDGWTSFGPCWTSRDNGWRVDSVTRVRCCRLRHSVGFVGFVVEEPLMDNCCDRGVSVQYHEDFYLPRMTKQNYKKIYKIQKKIMIQKKQKNSKYLQ